MCDKNEDRMFWPICWDCKTKITPGKELPWKWYDFYAAQGDKPLILCEGCWGLPKHQRRMAIDREDRAADIGIGGSNA